MDRKKLQIRTGQTCSLSIGHQRNEKGIVFILVDKQTSFKPAQQTDLSMIFFSKVPKIIAEKLGLPAPEGYTGHSFRTSTATKLANEGASGQTLKTKVITCNMCLETMP